jgi:hypothetical protein
VQIKSLTDLVPGERHTFAENMLSTPTAPSQERLYLKFSTSYGAALMLPNGASRTDLRSYDLLQQYVAKNAEKWYEYVTVVRGFDAPKGSLYIITGCDKCEHSELAAFYNPSYQQEDFAFQITVNNSSGAILGNLTHTAVLDCSVGHRRST